MKFSLKKITKVPFTSLTIGQTFVWNNRLFIKLGDLEMDAAIYNAVDLSDYSGILYYLCNLDMVDPVNGTFVED